MIKVLVADNSALFRKTITQILETNKEIKVVGIAKNGDDLINKAKILYPDVITTDIQLPVTEGLAIINQLVKNFAGPIVVISSLTKEGGYLTYKVLEAGAFDFIEKPDGKNYKKIFEIKKELIEKIKAAEEYNKNTKIRLFKSKDKRITEQTKTKDKEIFLLGKNRDDLTYGFKAVAIGISTGGPKNIHQVIPKLPISLNAAVFLVQHIPSNFTSLFTRNLCKNSTINVVEAESGLPVRSGNVYVATGGFHLTLFKKRSGDVVIRLSEKPEQRLRPSIDVMMESVLKIFGRDTMGVLMTGMGSDGAQAMVHIRESGGYTIAESDETSVVFGMPKEAIERGGASIVLPSYKVASEIIRWTKL